LDLFYEENFQPSLCSDLDKSEEFSFLKQDTYDKIFQLPLITLPLYVTKGMICVSDQIIHSEICLKNDASSCRGLLTTFPSSKNISESTIGKLRISSCQSTIQACKTHSLQLKNFDFSQGSFH
jgi:hypothetical protein